MDLVFLCDRVSNEGFKLANKFIVIEYDCCGLLFNVYHANLSRIEETPKAKVNIEDFSHSEAEENISKITKGIY